MRISVAMATYNGGRYLGEQLDSILCQLGEEDEVVISDDGSSDDTMIIIREFMERDGRVRYERGPREGVIANFENAIAACKGEYIFLADQDDVWLPDKVQTVMEQFAGNEKLRLVIHDAKVMTEDLRETMMKSFFAYRGSKPGVINGLIKNSYMGCCMAFRREVAEIALPIPRNLPMHDQWIGLVSDKFFGKSCFLQQPLLLYRRHSAAVSDFDHNSVGVMIRNRLMIIFELLKRIRYIRKERKYEYNN